jgi:hypothetical protein
MNTTVDSPYEAPITFLYAADRFRTLYSTAMSVCIQKFNYHVERGDTLFSLPIVGLTMESLRMISDGFMAEFTSMLDWPEKTVVITKREEEDRVFLDVAVDLNMLLLAASPMNRIPLIDGPDDFSHESCLRVDEGISSQPMHEGEEGTSVVPIPLNVVTNGDVFPPSFGMQ